MSTRISSHATHVGQFGSLINAYLVEEDDGLTLIDALQGDQSKKILEAAAKLGQPVKRILLTHAHPDHVGAVDALVAQLGESVELIVGSREARAMNEGIKLEAGEPTNGNLGKQRADSIRAAKPTRLIEDGARIGSLKAVWSPGHSLGHLAYLDERDGTLYCGDVYSTIGGVATTAGPFWRFPLPGAVTWHRPTVLNSARTLAALSPKRLCPGHGKTVEDPTNAMRAAIARRSEVDRAA
ncbi:MAG: MBL fold metallo-hydrolase [Solirubrobacteraceae bacterium]|nr:MBL fold metallo-hydrolase [Solirubrobacteraceae bacterium]